MSRFKMSLFLSALCFGLIAKEALAKTSCSIDLNKNFKPSEEPLFLKEKSNDILYPTEQGSILIGGGEKLRVYCGKDNFKNQPKHAEDTLLVQCLSGQNFRVLNSQDSNPRTYGLGLNKRNHIKPGSSSDLKSFVCKAVVRSGLKVGKSCGLVKPDRKHQQYTVGFPMKNGFIPLFDICFNNVTKSVLWSKHTITPAIEYHMSKVPRIQFIQDNHPYENHFNVNYLYVRKQQVETVANILESSSLAHKYIVDGGSSLAYFARGHLTPKGDFVYAGEQQATFHYINVAPQWQYFNGGQWEKIESSLRNYIIQRRQEAQILTLTLGITQLENEYNEEKDIYLYYNKERREKAIKVPKLYAKIIKFSKKPSDNVVVVGVNQPHEDHVKMTTNDIICEDACHRYPWTISIVEQNSDKYSAGYIYCCTPESFIAYLRTGKGYILDHSLPSYSETESKILGNSGTIEMDSYEPIDKVYGFYENESEDGEIPNLMKQDWSEEMTNDNAEYGQHADTLIGDLENFLA